MSTNNANGTNTASEPTVITPPESRCPSPVNAPRKAVAANKQLPARQLSMACAGLFLSNKFSDMTICVGNKKWPAHRMLLCSQSSFFDRAMNGGFKEGEDGIIHILDESPKDIYRMLHYLYKGDIEQLPKNGLIRSANGMMVAKYTESEEQHYALRINLAMRRLADKFDIPGLEDCAVRHQEFHFSKLENGSYLPRPNVGPPGNKWKPALTLASALLQKIYGQTETPTDLFRVHGNGTFFRLLRKVGMSAEDLKTFAPLQALIKEQPDFVYDMMAEMMSVSNLSANCYYHNTPGCPCSEGLDEMEDERADIEGTGW
ncbi:hypothetical protein BJ508DRAFT_418005 [Ascobolus immersus RN42]|uniref:BTB domain-containing protein n=1 Tax=Ascobolus immersus RN42 TaxID=1160509 RepID=A0A3N4HPL4_ASCIM|nr:hypothetical protein BJ508DRAFT_418005 [Ascobolus immersus RN42]